MRLIREDDTLSLSRKSELAGVSRSSLYYEPKPVDERTLMLRRLVDRLYMAVNFSGLALIPEDESSQPSRSSK